MELCARVTRAGDVVYRRCHGPGTLRLVTDQIVRRFRLARRAHPADVGAG